MKVTTKNTHTHIVRNVRAHVSCCGFHQNLPTLLNRTQLSKLSGSISLAFVGSFHRAGGTCFFFFSFKTLFQYRSPVLGTNYLEFDWLVPENGTAVLKKGRRGRGGAGRGGTWDCPGGTFDVNIMRRRAESPSCAGRHRTQHRLSLFFLQLMHMRLQGNIPHQFQVFAKKNHENKGRASLFQF